MEQRKMTRPTMMMCLVRSSSRRCIATFVLVVGVVLCHFILELEPVPYAVPQNSLRSDGASSQWQLLQNVHGNDDDDDDENYDNDDIDSKDAGEDSDNDDDENELDDPFPPPLYGYDSINELLDRPNRFPSVTERVQVYMSNWYLPPCPDTEVPSGFIHYKYYAAGNKADTLSSFPLLLVREVTSQAQGQPRKFALDAQNGLGKIHYLQVQQMQSEQCDSEYCVDMVRHWIPAMERVLQSNKSNNYDTVPVPVLFQFSDEELSKAYNPTTDKNEPYPNLPHLKKSRLSLRPQDIYKSHEQTCESVPKAILPTVDRTDHVPEHLQPSKFLMFLAPVIWSPCKTLNIVMSLPCFF